MKAIEITQTGGPEVLKIQDVTLKSPGAGQVLVAIKASGVNFIDIYQRRGIYPVKLPYILGMEAAGVIEAVGQGVKDFKVGDRVAFIHEPGCYAEKCLVNMDDLIPLPEKLSFEQGAAFPLQGMTAHYLLYEFKKIKKGDVILIHAAAGGMGLLLTQWAKHLGARVIGTTSSEEKAKIAKDAGADDIIIYTKQNFVTEIQKLTSGHGADLIIDGVGKTTVPGDLQACAIRGHIVIFGAASGQPDPISTNDLKSKSLTLSSATLFRYIGNREELLMRANAVLDAVQQGFLKLRIDKAFPLAEARLAHERLEKRESAGKILLIP